MKRDLCWFFLAVLLLATPFPVFSAEKEWTYLVFMNADNNLDSYADEDFQEMMKVGSSQWLNIVSLTDREKGPAALHFIEKNNNVVLKPMGELDMGDYQVMVNFVREAAKAYPAKHYVLSIWNHGSGWKNQSKTMTKGISYDDSTGNYITTPQLGVALKEIKGILGKNLDILSMDACLMQMMEVAYEVRESCDFIVASEELEPGHGYPYDLLLAELKAGTTPENFCKRWIPVFMAAYMGGAYGKEACTLSAINCSRLADLKDAIDGFSKALMAGSFSLPIKDALSKVQKFDTRTNIDFLHLARLLQGSIHASEVQTALKKLESVLVQVIIANGNTGGTLKNSLGLAIYFPQTASQFSSEYSTLAFSQNSLWDEMLRDFYKKSVAEPMLAEIRSANLDSLRDYVKSASQADSEISSYVKTRINYLIFVEGGFSRSFQKEISQLLSGL